ncbi:hypothetical protein UPYG_G00332970 [Umbra pygmaea]|uniref:Uncharacterized protein n=1 Tax=Umbra pygmaea TaxID=75934 RepID=A0ABD0VWR3_UMBPY
MPQTAPEAPPPQAEPAAEHLLRVPATLPPVVAATGCNAPSAIDGCTVPHYLGRWLCLPGHHRLLCPQGRCLGPTSFQVWMPATPSEREAYAGGPLRWAGSGCSSILSSWRLVVASGVLRGPVKVTPLDVWCQCSKAQTPLCVHVSVLCYPDSQ